jgi:hypothetical protein
MPNNLSVAVSADVTDLQVKFAVAKAETSALTSEMNKLAKQSAAGTLIDPAGQAKLQEIAGDLIKARAETAALSAEMKEMTGATQGVGSALEEMQSKLSTAFQTTGIAAAAEAVNLVREAIERAADEARQVSAGAETLGVSVAQYQAMAHAAEEAGVGTDSLAHASERLEIMLGEARNGSAAAIEKLYTLGVTTEQIHDPMFTVIDLLGVEKERLEDSSTAVQARGALLQVLGTRMAAVIPALKEFDGSETSVAKVMAEVNGLSDEQVQKLKEVGATAGTFGTAIENTFSKAVVFEAEALGKLTSLVANYNPQSLADKLIGGAPDPAAAAAAAQQTAQAQSAAARAAASEEGRINLEILQQEMENAKAGVAAYKEGTQQKLDQLEIYAAAAQRYYGTDTVEPVVKANQEIIAQQRAVTDAQTAAAQKQKSQLQELTDFSRQMSDSILLDHQRLALESAKITADEVKEEKKQALELFGGWDQTYTEITARHAELLKQQNADTERAAKQDSKSYESVVGEIESAESSMVSNILTKRKGLSQSLEELGAQLVTKEIANDLRAVTTSLLLHESAANQQKALDQGGLIYHMFATNQATTNDVMKQAQQTSATVSSQAAQTSAVMTGNAARLASTDAAAASSAATSAAVGSKTVMQDAAKAFSGTYASVAQIPYVGWILAPVAASAAYAGVAAYEGLASLDTGTNYVPQDQIAQIHQGEAVIPKQFNPAANPFAMAGGGYSEEHNYHGAVNVNAFDAQSMARMLSRSGGRNAVLSGAVKALRRGARP